MNWRSYPVKELIHITAFFSMFEIECDKTYVFHGETHDFWECVYVQEGEICVSADERVYNMNAGKIIFHKPNEFHKFHINGENNAKLFIFSYTSEGELNTYFHDKVFYLSEKQQRMIKNLTDFTQGEINRLNMHIKNGQGDMYLIPFEKNPMYSQIVTIYIYDLFFSLFYNNEALPVSKSYESEIFGEAVNLMNKQISANLSVDEISKQLRISQSGLKRIFKKYTGLGVHKYFLTLKLKYAREMLESGFSVTATAYKLGFSSQGYFTKTYRRETGVLPSECLKK